MANNQLVSRWRRPLDSPCPKNSHFCHENFNQSFSLVLASVLSNEEDLDFLLLANSAAKK